MIINNSTLRTDSSENWKTILPLYMPAGRESNFGCTTMRAGVLGEIVPLPGVKKNQGSLPAPSRAEMKLTVPEPRL
jgi:hypothetical protein